jgi:hypothetical protein
MNGCVATGAFEYQYVHRSFSQPRPPFRCVAKSRSSHLPTTKCACANFVDFATQRHVSFTNHPMRMCEFRGFCYATQWRPRPWTHKLRQTLEYAHKSWILEKVKAHIYYGWTLYLGSKVCMKAPKTSLLFWCRYEVITQIFSHFLTIINSTNWEFFLMFWNCHQSNINWAIISCNTDQHRFLFHF